MKTNKSTHIPGKNSLPLVKVYTFRKMVSLIESLLSLDFRGSGIHVSVDQEALSTDLVFVQSPYRKNTLTFQIAADASVLVLGNGHADSLNSLNVPEISRIIESFVKENSSFVN